MAVGGRSRSGPDWSFESAAAGAGFRCIAGVDEAGRGCLFGPVFAAAVVLRTGAEIPGLDDSKRLNPSQREALDRHIRQVALTFAVRAVDAATIDLLNILQASRRAMKLAVESLDPAPDFLLVDATAIDLPIPQEGIVKGDSKSNSIAAASILAKVARDQCMLVWDSLYPEYGLRKHKGYPSPKHMAALRKYGCTPQHRFSYGPVKRLARFEPDAPPSG